MIGSRKVTLGLLALLSLALTGCGDPQAAHDSVRGRVVDALVGVPTGFADLTPSHGVISAANVNLGSISNYVSGPYGGADYSVTPTGASAPLITGLHIDVQQDQTQTVAIAGVVGQTGLLAPRVFRFEDTAPTNFASKDTNVVAVAIRLINLSPGSGPFDLVQVDANGNATSSFVGLLNITYGNSGSYGFYTLPADKQGATTLPYATTALAVRDTNTGAVFPTTITGQQLLNGGLLTIYVVGQATPAAGPATLKLAVSSDI